MSRVVNHNFISILVAEVVTIHFGA